MIVLVVGKLFVRLQDLIRDSPNANYVPMRDRKNVTCARPPRFVYCCRYGENC